MCTQVVPFFFVYSILPCIDQYSSSMNKGFHLIIFAHCKRHMYTRRSAINKRKVFKVCNHPLQSVSLEHRNVKTFVSKIQLKVTFALCYAPCKCTDASQTQCTSPVQQLAWISSSEGKDCHQKEVLSALVLRLDQKLSRIEYISGVLSIQTKLLGEGNIYNIPWQSWSWEAHFVVWGGISWIRALNLLPLLKVQCARICPSICSLFRRYLVMRKLLLIIQVLSIHIADIYLPTSNWHESPLLLTTVVVLYVSTLVGKCPLVCALILLDHSWS